MVFTTSRKNLEISGRSNLISFRPLLLRKVMLQYLFLSSLRTSSSTEKLRCRHLCFARWIAPCDLVQNSLLTSGLGCFVCLFFRQSEWDYIVVILCTNRNQFGRKGPGLLPSHWLTTVWAWCWCSSTYIKPVSFLPYPDFPYIRTYWLLSMLEKWDIWLLDLFHSEKGTLNSGLFCPGRKMLLIHWELSFFSL